MKQNKIPTAEEYLKKLDEESGTIWTEDDDSICEAFREFAKFHVKAALEAALEESPYGSSTDTVSYEDMKKTILNAYPDENIK